MDPPVVLVFDMEQKVYIPLPEPAKINVYDYYEPSVSKMTQNNYCISKNELNVCKRLVQSLVSLNRGRGPHVPATIYSVVC